MYEKKTKKADLERKRFAFFQIGLILAGSLCLAAFEFVTPVFGTLKQQAFEQDTVYNMPPIPVQFTASAQPKTKTIQPIVDEVALVVKIDPQKVVEKKPDLIDLDLGEISKMFGEGDSLVFTPTDVGKFDNPDVMPIFPGSLNNWIAKNIKLPEALYSASGTIYVSFVVSKTGEVVNVKISQSLDRDHDRAAIAVVKKMPKWKPGEMFGKPVAVNYHLPIRIIRR